MTGTTKNMNIHATPLNNVQFGRVFYCPPIGKSLPDCSPHHLGGGFSFNLLTHGGKDMKKNKGKVVCAEQMTEDVLIQVEEKRFEKKYQEKARSYFADMNSNLQSRFSSMEVAI